MLKIIIPEDDKKLDQQIKALEWLIKEDIINNRAKDQQIHEAALKDLRQAKEERK